MEKDVAFCRRIDSAFLSSLVNISTSILFYDCVQVIRFKEGDYVLEHVLQRGD